jgi:putative membrane protein
MMYYGWGGMGWGGGLLMALVGIVFIALVIWAIIKVTNHQTYTSTIKQTPLDIARERYAKGDITKDQFELIKKDLIQ